MANDTIITIVGNLTADPELRFTPSGAAVSNFVVASTPRHFDKQANEFKDGETLFARCSAWREMAESVAESLSKGDRVVVQGRMKATSWQDKETGQRRTGWEVDADEVAPSLRWATAQVSRNQKGNQNQPQTGFGGGQQQTQAPQQSWDTPQSPVDPWSGGNTGDTPPF